MSNHPDWAPKALAFERENVSRCQRPQLHPIARVNAPVVANVSPLEISAVDSSILIFLTLICPVSGRATCDPCRTRKRLKSASQIAQRRETLGSLQLENQWLTHKLTQTSSKLAASEQEVARLVELLGNHAGDALDIHTLHTDRQAAPAANASNPMRRESLIETGNNLPPPCVDRTNVTYYSEETGAGAGYPCKHRTPHTDLLALPVIQSRMPLAYEPEVNQMRAVPQPASFNPLKRKAPCESQGAQAPQLDAPFGTQFVYEMDEFSQFVLHEDHSMLPTSSSAPAV